MDLKRSSPLIPILFFILLIVLTACHPQTVEVEVTRVVVETEAVEVEVTRPVSEVEEIIVDSVLDAVEAAGSEEDGGTPFVPPAGDRAKIPPIRVASAGWVNIGTITESEPIMRLIEESAGQVIVIHQIETPSGRSTLVINEEALFFDQTLANLPPVTRFREAAPADLTPSVANLQPTDELIELSAQLQCDRCEAQNQGETIVLLWPTSGLTIHIDQDENVPLLAPLLDELRAIHQDQRRLATWQAFRLGEWKLR